MWVYINTEVLKKVGVTKAYLLEHIFMRTHSQLGTAILNVSAMSRDLDISLSTLQRALKDLTAKGYLDKSTQSTYSLTTQFYNEFKEYQSYVRTQPRDL